MLRTIDKIPFASFSASSATTLSALDAAIEDEMHDIFDIDMKELMQAASRITKKEIQQAVKQIFLKRIQLGSMRKGRSSSYVRLVVIELLKRMRS